MVRRAELGAGIAAAIMGVAALLVVLFVPLVAVCAVKVSFTNVCPPHHIRLVTIPRARLASGAWVYLIGVLVIVFAGAAGAIADARYAWRASALPLWGAAVLAFGGCCLVARTVLGLVFLPAVLALLLGAYLAIARRMPARARPRPAGDEPPPTPDAPAPVVVDAGAPERGAISAPAGPPPIAEHADEGTSAETDEESEENAP